MSIPLLVAVGVRRDGQKVLLSVKNMGGEAEAAWRHVLEDLLARGLKVPELLIVDGGKGLEAALAGLWSDIPVQRRPAASSKPAAPTRWTFAGPRNRCLRDPDWNTTSRATGGRNSPRRYPLSKDSHCRGG